MSAMNQERLLKVILAPVVSEKSTRVADKGNQITFKVMSDATKQEISAAVEMLFKVEVTAVQTLNVKGKAKRNKFGMGRQKNWKKAYVCIKPGQEIDLAAA
jgi:large subunit ribosomal protein L23